MTTDRTTLITFLGRVPRDDHGYRKTRYDFGDGQSADEFAFFGWALQRQIKPQNIVILGTIGSMWDHLFEGDFNLGAAAEHQREALMGAVDAQSVTQHQLDELAPALAAHLNCRVRLGIVPYAYDGVAADLLVQMAADVFETDIVHLDVTHGLRHLPMLALLSALYIRITKRATIAGIWYGAYDCDTGRGQAHNLAGIMRIADSLQALSSFDKDGDYGVFMPLLEQSGASPQVVEALKKASYYENLLNVGQATGQLRRALRALETEAPGLAPDVAPLLPTIQRRLQWVDEDRQFEKQLALATHALERRDYLRATLYAYEAVITRICQIQGAKIESFEERDGARKVYEKQSEGLPEYQDYKLLKHLRNEVAHGTRGSTAEVQRALLNESVMRELLNRLLDAIRQGRLPSRRDGV